MPSKLRQLFASILLFCDIQELNISKLFHDHINNLNEDFIYQQKQIKENNDLIDDDYEIAKAKTLFDIEKYLIPYEKSLADYSLPVINYSLLNEEQNQKSDLILEEMNYNIDELNNDLLTKEKLLNNDQKRIYYDIIKAVNNEISDSVFFVDGPGGYGKTFLFNTILAKVRSQKNIALAVASSGIAALLLDGGRTAHSRFKISLKLTETSLLNISQQSDLAELIKATKLIIWDEAPMAHRFAFEAVDKTF